MKTSAFASRLTSTLFAVALIIGMASCTKEVVEPATSTATESTARKAEISIKPQVVTPIHPSHPVYHPEYKGTGNSTASIRQTPDPAIGSEPATSDERELRTRNHNTISSMEETISTQEIFHPAYSHKVLIKDKR